MKRIFMFFGAALLVSAVSCQKGLEENADETPVTPEVEEPAEPVEPAEPEELALYAEIAQTKTTLQDGFKVVWNKSDRLAVFNAPTGTTQYSDNLQFVIDEDASGKFTPGEDVEVPFEEGVNYDWFVCSPYRVMNGVAELVTPAGQSTADGYFPIGYATQTGYNSSVHIGGIDIMVGKAADTRTPQVTLKHLAVLHKFTVTNQSDKPTVITKLSFNGGDNILFGTFWIDMTADNPAIDVTKANDVFTERALTVKDGEELAVGESADFYMMTAPFTLGAGETFKVTIETSTGTQVVEKTAASDIEFAAGTYNTASLVYDYVPVYAEHLYFETFDGSQTLAAVSTASNEIRTDRWGKYDKTGLSVYDGVISAVTYEDASNSTLSKYVSETALPNMTELYMCLWDNGTITIKGIKLHDYTKLNLSFIHAYKKSEVKVEYSIDNGENWMDIETYTNSSTSACETRSTDFELSQSSEYIWLRFTGTGTTRPRIDNIKLTWQTE